MLEKGFGLPALSEVDLATPLNDIVVLDLSRNVAGAYCSKLLASLGAAVIKVEPPGGDPVRRLGPFWRERVHPETGIPFLHLNTGKQSISLNLETRTGQRLFKRLLSACDVLVESFTPGYLADLGLDPESLAALNPGLILCSVSYFGQSGPYARFRGSDMVASALGGLLLLVGDPDKPPLKPYGYQAEYQAGLQAAVGAMVALAYRDGGGQGQQVDVSAMEAASFLLGGAPQVYYFEGKVPLRNGNRLVGFGPSMGYPSTYRPCRDGWVHVHTSYRNPELLAALVLDERLSQPEVLQESFAHADEIDAIVDMWLADRDKWEAAAAAQELRLPFTPVLSPAEVVEDRQKHLEARRFFRSVNHPLAGALLQPGPPIRLNTGQEADDLPRAPLLGEHNVEVYCRRLGLSFHDLSRLRAAAAI